MYLHVPGLPLLQEMFEAVNRGGIKTFKAFARLASNSKFLLAKSEEKLAKIMSLLSICTACTLSVLEK
jgi:hypothetical protein